MSSPTRRSGPPILCRFGWRCHRSDCFYSHPDGRGIDGVAPPFDPRLAVVPPAVYFAPPPQGMVPTAVPPGPVVHMAGPAGFAPVAMTLPFPPGPSAPGGPAGPSAASGPRVCRFDRACTRVDCYFQHPNGREMELGASGAPSAESVTGDAEDEDKEESDLKEIERAMEDDDDEVAHLAGGVDEDSWYPASQSCECCQGFIYRCVCHGLCLFFLLCFPPVPSVYLSMSGIDHSKGIFRDRFSSLLCHRVTVLSCLLTLFSAADSVCKKCGAAAAAAAEDDGDDAESPGQSDSAWAPWYDAATTFFFLEFLTRCGVQEG